MFWSRFSYDVCQSSRSVAKQDYLVWSKEGKSSSRADLQFRVKHSNRATRATDLLVPNPPVAKRGKIPNPSFSLVVLAVSALLLSKRNFFRCGGLFVVTVSATVPAAAACTGAPLPGPSTNLHQGTGCCGPCRPGTGRPRLAPSRRGTLRFRCHVTQLVEGPSW